MKLDDFIKIIEKVKSFKFKLERENIVGTESNIILKIYMQELAPKINIKYLKVVE